MTFQPTTISAGNLSADILYLEDAGLPYKVVLTSREETCHVNFTYLLGSEREANDLVKGWFKTAAHIHQDLYFFCMNHA